MKKMSPAQYSVMIRTLEDALEYAKQLPIDASCETCTNWGANGCSLAGGAMPPKEVQENGCEAYQCDMVPF